MITSMNAHIYRTIKSHKTALRRIEKENEQPKVQKKLLKRRAAEALDVLAALASKTDVI